MTTGSSTPTEDTIRQLIERQLKLAVHGYQLGPDDNLWDMGLSSLTCLGLMLDLEDVFEVELPQELLKESTFRSLNSIRDAVETARCGEHEPAGASAAAR
jgi:acyl carrier protein